MFCSFWLAATDFALPPRQQVTPQLGAASNWLQGGMISPTPSGRAASPSPARGPQYGRVTLLSPGLRPEGRAREGMRPRCRSLGTATCTRVGWRGQPSGAGGEQVMMVGVGCPPFSFCPAGRHTATPRGWAPVGEAMRFGEGLAVTGLGVGGRE